MSKLTNELDRLHDRILATEADTRHRFQPQLAALIDRMDGANEPVPAGIRGLCEELTCAAIEARLDNVPV